MSDKSGPALDIEAYLRDLGVRQPYDQFRAKIEERARAVGVPMSDVTIHHWLFRNLVEQWRKDDGAERGHGKIGE